MLLFFLLKHSVNFAVNFDGGSIFLIELSFLAELFIESLLIGDVPISFNSCFDFINSAWIDFDVTATAGSSSEETDMDLSLPNFSSETPYLDGVAFSDSDDDESSSSDDYSESDYC